MKPPFGTPVTRAPLADLMPGTAIGTAARRPIASIATVWKSRSGPSLAPALPTSVAERA
jgi:hypothetical protein